jgi:hypothetical protein
MAWVQRCLLTKLGFVLAGIPMYYITQRGALMALQRRFREHRVYVCFHEGTYNLPSLLQHLYPLYRAFTTRQRGRPGLDGRLSLLRVMTISK